MCTDQRCKGCSAHSPSVLAEVSEGASIGRIMLITRRRGSPVSLTTSASGGGGSVICCATLYRILARLIRSTVATA